LHSKSLGFHETHATENYKKELKEEDQRNQMGKKGKHQFP
jgi:hypothetical protein